MAISPEEAARRRKAQEDAAARFAAKQRQKDDAAKKPLSEPKKPGPKPGANNPGAFKKKK